MYSLNLAAILKPQACSTVLNQEVPQPAMPKPSYSVIVKNPPIQLDNPAARKNFLDSVGGSSSTSIVHLSTRKEAWRLVLSNKSDPRHLANALSSSDKSIEAEVKNPSFMG